MADGKPPRGRGWGRGAPKSPASSTISSSSSVRSLQDSPPKNPSTSSPPKSTYSTITSSSSSGKNLQEKLESSIEEVQQVTKEEAEQKSPGSSGSGSRGHLRGVVPSTTANRYELVATRPTVEGFTKQGTGGREVNLMVNYFRLRTGPKFNIYLHSLVFNPDQDSDAIRKHLVKKHREEIGPYIYDGGFLIFGTNKYDSETYSGTKEGKEYSFELKFAKTVMPGDPLYIQFFNITLKKVISSMQLEAVGARGHYDVSKAIYIKNHGLTIWPGFITSIRNHEHDVLLCVEVTHKVLRTDNVLKVLGGLNQSSEEEKQRALNEIVDSIILTSYNKKTYKVKGILWEEHPTDTFMRRGQEVSFMEYYREQYGIKIGAPRQPLLFVEFKNRNPRDPGYGQMIETKLIPELCQMTGLTDAMRSNIHLMKSISNVLHQAPADRVNTINGFMNQLERSQIIYEYNPETKTQMKRPLVVELKRWGLEFDPNLMTCRGRVLEPENIIFDNGEDNATFKADWNPSFRKRHMLTSVNLANWILLAPERDNANVINLISTIQRVASTMKFQISRPKKIIPVRSPNKTDYMKSLEQAMGELGSQVELVFIILPNNGADLYSAVKRLLCVDYGIPSQCFLTKNLTGPKGTINLSICTKVAIQMNAKLGGIPWSIKTPAKKIMIIGFDVYHGKTGKSKNSLGAFVASITDNFGKYYSAICVHEHNKEMATQLGAQIQKAIEAYRQQNDCLPEKIIMYRDGVGEGQLKEVQDGEVQPMEDALMRFYDAKGAPPPKFTFIVVTKKINTRMIKVQGMSNPDPGTVLDDVVTLPERFDFYLVAQQARQGTVSPTSYHVMKDGCGLGAARIQRFTWKLCHLYYNWSGTVCVPAPCQYAHKLAALTGISLGTAANASLANTLFYL